MWRKDVTPNDLRMILPDTALQMETMVHCFELRKLQIKHKVKWSAGRKNVTIIIPATPNHEIRISPIDRAMQGFAEWNTYSTPMRQRSLESDFERRFPEYAIRAYVQVKNCSDSNLDSCLSFTITGRNIENLLREIVGFYKNSKNIEIDPFILKRGNQ
jgi:hypothetical protein